MKILVVIALAVASAVGVQAQTAPLKIKFVGAANGVYTFQLGATELRVKCLFAARYTGDGTNSDHIHPVPCVFNAPPGTTYTLGDNDMTKWKADSVMFQMAKLESGESNLTITRFGHLFLHLQIGEVVLPEYDITFRVLSAK
jgi:hypothetical protein